MMRAFLHGLLGADSCVSRDVFSEGLKGHIVSFQDSKLSENVQNGLGVIMHIYTKHEDVGHQENKKKFEYDLHIDVFKVFYCTDQKEGVKRS